jgi:hypothetical protein
MEKKDWKQRLGSYDSWAMNESMFITIDGETIYTLDKLLDFIQQELDKAREEGRREVYKAIVFDENIPHDITTFVAANLWKNMRDKAKEELSKLKDNK